ncbi:UNVERIFIED_CONTAM: hypothetical protein Sradi_0773200 [Sesamum radiatum]|uniref:Uncharacterized protein n=1 Tax=Sesamum radiatum TaxID=300843 RepID=A0AAW2VPP9_SESRA
MKSQALAPTFCSWLIFKRRAFRLLVIPIVPKLRHMQKKLISAQPRDTASHDPWRMLPIVFSDQLLKVLNVLVGPSSSFPPSFYHTL